MHLALTGRGRERVLASLRWLAAHDRLAEVRLLLVRGGAIFSTPLALLEALTTFAVAGACPSGLNGFRHHGVRGEALSWQKPGRLIWAVLANALKAKGVWVGDAAWVI